MSTRDAHVWPVQYAIEADPGECTASFPVYATEEAARDAAGYIDSRRPDLPPCRILRREISPWLPVEPAHLDPTHDRAAARVRSA